AATADHHLGAQFTNGAHLVLRHQLGETDDRLHTLLRGGEGQRTAVVAGGRGNHAEALLRIIQLRHCVARTTQLEAAGGLLRLQLQPYRHTGQAAEDRKSTRLNSSHVKISYAVFCLKKKKDK